VSTRCGDSARLLLILLLVGSLWLPGPVGAETLQEVRVIDREPGPGAPFPPEAGFRLGLRPDGSAALHWTDGSRALPDPALVSFDDDDGRGGRRVFALDPVSGELLVLRPGAGPGAVQKRRLGELVGLDVGGFAVDAAGDQLFALDAAHGRILHVEGVLRGSRRRSSEIALPANPPPLRGLARNPVSGHLFALAPATGELLEITTAGELVAVHRLPAQAREARSIAIASSSDRTDDPARQSLFVAALTEQGSTTYELAVEPLQLAAVGTEVPSLLQTILTSNFTPPSPDPSGVDLLGPNGPLLICDGEVEEMSIYRGVNLWEVSTSGTQLWTGDTTFFSGEPTGAARNAANGRYYFSDDGGSQWVYEVTPGSDGRVTSGDSVRSIRVGNYGPIDSEGVAFGGGFLWIAGGSEAEVYKVAPGPNGVFDGGGDDVVSHFDTSASGLTDTEGIAYDGDGGNVYVAGPSQDGLVAHFSPSGQLLRWLDISAASPKNPAGLAYGPGPAGSTTRRLYVVARGTDNNTDPSENDGKLFAFAVNPLGGGGGPTNQPPSVSAGPDLAVDLSAAASLDGTVTDDGLPSGTLTTTWTRVSGPGTVSFGNPNAVDTSATFSSVGSYVLRLAANDGELQVSDETTVTVTSSGGGGTTTVEKRIAASADDAEQGASGGVDVDSSDLEIVADGGDVQTIGLRFGGLAIPPGAPIVAAWIQFQTDEVSTAATSLVLQGEASDNAAPYTSGTNNVGARPRTAASVTWTPPAWNLVGEAGAAQRTPDLSALVQQVVNRGGWLSGNAMAFVITGSGTRVAESFDGTAAGAPLLHVVFEGAAGNLAPVVSAGPDRSISLGQTAALDGTVSDDGLPNGTLTTTWSKVSGPGTVSFANASAVDTTAGFSTSGSYVLRLTASDGERSTQDEMAVTVLGNVAPSVSAGPDRTVFLGQSAALDGTVSDDGLPNGTLTTTWSKVSGPGTVSFANASAVDTTASFGAFGSYVLRLTASDGELSAQDDVAVSVLDPNAGGVIDQRISVGADDAEQRLSNGVVALAGGDLNMAVDGTRAQLVGMRFANLPIPAGATIQNAWIQFMVDEVGSTAASLTIQTEATANPAPFVATANNLGARPRSAAAVAWSPPAWTLVREAGAAQRTPSLASVVQEAVNRPGWAPGNAMVFLVSGSGERTAESFEGRASGAALLHVEYGPGS
jgi:hypothetical protein